MGCSNIFVAETKLRVWPVSFSLHLQLSVLLNCARQTPPPLPAELIIVRTTLLRYFGTRRPRNLDAFRSALLRRCQAYLDKIRSDFVIQEFHHYPLRCASRNLWGNYQQISEYNVHLTCSRKPGAAWYAWMNNDVLATGILSFAMHEIVYFGRSLPWIVVGMIPYFNREQDSKCEPPVEDEESGVKLTSSKQKMPTAQEQWNCARLVLISHFTVELPQIWLFHPVAQFFDLILAFPSHIGPRCCTRL